MLIIVFNILNEIPYLARLVYLSIHRCITRKLTNLSHYRYLRSMLKILLDYKRGRGENSKTAVIGVRFHRADSTLLGNHLSVSRS